MMINGYIMKSTIRIIAVLVIFFSLTSCVKKAYLAEEELATINVYNEGEILIFQNIVTKATDTTRITIKEIYHPDYDWFRHDGYQPQIAKIWYKNKKLKYGVDNQDILIGKEKRKPDDEIGYGISYLYSTFFSNESDLKLNTVTLDSVPKTFNQVYIFTKKKGKHFKEDKHNWKPRTLYWDKEFGIIKYITYDGEVWERINW